MFSYCKCTTLILSLSKSNIRPNNIRSISSSPSTLAVSDRAMDTISPSLLAQAWTPAILQWTDDDDSTGTKDAPAKADHSHQITQAIERTLPLLGGGAATGGADSVPFVCRYRSDIIDPLSTKQVHLLQSLLTKHAGLSSLRSKVLQALPSSEPPPLQVLTSTSKTELEDWYAPYKPPSKGSILERIQTEHPQLVEAVEDLWMGKSDKVPFSLGPKEALLHLLGSKIAADPHVVLIVMDELQKHCRIHTKLVETTTKPEKEAAKKQKTSTSASELSEKYTFYDDFRGHLMHLKDYQVLAIRRGIKNKQLSISYDIDGDKMESSIAYHLRASVPSVLVKNHRELYSEAIHESWTRFLRRRGTSRLWASKCRQAQERAYEVFQENLRRALLVPPLDLRLQKEHPSEDWAPWLVALDPGYNAGIKCAILNFQGAPERLDTIHFLGPRRQEGMDKLIELLKVAAGGKNGKVVVALGNGHGSQECRMLLQEASIASAIPVDVQSVSEAGASVWSVTEAAKREFPDEHPAAIAAICLGRRLLNPLSELVKIPPRSLGLGMYQHDLVEKELDERLHLGSVDAVATVGVDVNSCSLEIMEKVPGMKKIAPKIIAARPLSQRADLLKVSGLGPKTFENCAAFLRLSPAVAEPLDATLVHPESYDLARWLLNQLAWDLQQNIPDLPPRSEWLQTWDTLLGKASNKFQVSPERVLAVFGNLVDSINPVDPRIKDLETNSSTIDPCRASTKGCIILPLSLVESKALASAVPVRGILGVVRNISDFGAFVSFGGHSDGLLHKSMLQSNLRLENLLIGQSIGVDIVRVQGNRISLAIHGSQLATSSAFKISTESSQKRKLG